MQTTLFIAAAILYAVCALLPSPRGAVISGVTALAWVMHGAALWPDMLANGTLRVGFAFMLSAALWISVVAWWIENRNLALDGMRRLIMPCAAVASLLPPLFPGSLMPVESQTPAFGWHVAVAVMAYSTLTIAAFHAVLMAVQEASLHTPPGGRLGWFAAMIERLPALMTMERLLFRMIGIGFILLSLTVLSGIVFSEQLFGRALRWDHKNFFALLSWVLFAALLAGRRWRGWRGKTALRFTLAGFATLALAYVGSRFVFEVVLHRGFT
jgi:ABC-type uncharacterized transport system permease subunit